MDSISTARDFFINQQGLSPDQADMIVSKGMEAYNQRTNTPQNMQSMMQMASGGIANFIDVNQNGIDDRQEDLVIKWVEVQWVLKQCLWIQVLHYKFHNKCLLIFLQHKVLQ
jgi:hypothetical protein